MNRLILLLLPVLLLGCAASGHNAQRYRLPALDRSPAIGQDHTLATLQLQTVRLAGFIDTRGLLYQTSDIEISEARQHQWGETIGSQLTRALRLQLAGSVAGLRVLDSADTRAADPVDYHLQVRLERFQGRFDGVAVVSGTWQLRDAAGGLLAMNDFAIEQPLPEDGHAALVRSLGRAWSDLGRQLADALRAQDARLRVRPPDKAAAGDPAG